MPGRRKRLPGVVLYWVVCRDEDTTELLDSYSFSTIDEARRFQIDYEERADPPGHICKVDIEVILTGDLPPKFRK